MLKTITKTIVLIFILMSLSGCIAVAAGAAGGYYFQKHYKIEKKTNKNSTPPTQETATTKITQSTDEKS